MRQSYYLGEQTREGTARNRATILATTQAEKHNEPLKWITWVSSISPNNSITNHEPSQLNETRNINLLQLTQDHFFGSELDASRLCQLSQFNHFRNLSFLNKLNPLLNDNHLNSANSINPINSANSTNLSNSINSVISINSGNSKTYIPSAI